MYIKLLSDDLRIRFSLQRHKILRYPHHVHKARQNSQHFVPRGAISLIFSNKLLDILIYIESYDSFWSCSQTNLFNLSRSFLYLFLRIAQINFSSLLGITSTHDQWLCCYRVGDTYRYQMGFFRYAAVNIHYLPLNRPLSPTVFSS